MTPLRIGIAGINGRMGKETILAAQGDERFVIVGGVVRPESQSTHLDGLLVTSRIEELLPEIDLLIDLSTPGMTPICAAAAANADIPLLCGVTGLDDQEILALRTAAKSIPVHWSRNLSQGIPLVADLVRQLAAALSGYDVEIIEAHHRGKKDAPSGTALLLAEAIASGRDQSLDEIARYGRDGIAPRLLGEVGIHAVRGGSLPGEHTIIFAGDHEEIRIQHRALSRRAFAKGALEAARVLSVSSAGFHVT